MRFWPGFLLAASLAMSSCIAQPRTQIIVRVDSDMPIRPSGGINAIELVVRSQEGMERARYPVQLSADPALPARYFPIDLFAIEPLRGDPTRAVTVEATAIDGMDRLFTVRAVASFVVGRTSILELFLAGQCRTRVDPCPQDFSCSRNGECVADHRMDLPLAGDGGVSRDVPTPPVDTFTPVVDTYVPPPPPPPPPPPIDVPDPPRDPCLGVGARHGDGCCPANTTWCNDNDCPKVMQRADGCCAQGVENACSDPENCPVIGNDGCCASAVGENCSNSFNDCRNEPACSCDIRCCDNSLQITAQPNEATCAAYAQRPGACPRLRVRYGGVLIFERSIACP